MTVRFLRQRVVRLVCLALIIAPVATCLSRPVAADDYGYSDEDGNGAIPLPDSQDHWFCFASVPLATHRSVIRDSMSFLDDATNMYDVESSSCGSSTDIWFYTAALPTAVLGATSCQSWAFWAVCDRSNVYLENDQFVYFGGLCGNTPGEVEFNYIHTTRHEIGHTTGLQHDPPVGAVCSNIGGNDAMSSDWVNVNFFYVAYSQHHVQHVNCVCDL